MRFRRIELENLFAYDGCVPFDFPDRGTERNIALIWGRNGMGKTSFLRAMKLLFLGVAPPKVRTVGFPPKTLGERQYVLGDGGNWSGLINRQAARRAAASDVPATARVSATWEHDDGSTVTAERHWTATAYGYDEHAVVFDGRERLAGDPAKDRIGDMLPPEFVDFFFFDGEEIKSLAESDERKQIDFDRLLRITFIGELAGELGRVANERARRDMGGELLEKYTAEEAALVKARGARDVARQALSEIDEAIATDRAQLRRLQTRRENLSSGASDAQREALEHRRTEARRAISEQQERVAEVVPPTAPLLANLGLVRAALEATDQRLDSASRAERMFLERISPHLPVWLVEEADLDAAAAGPLAERLVRRMEGELPEGGARGPFASLDPLRAEKLREMLSRWATAGEDALRAQAAELDGLRRAQRDLQDVSNELMRIEVGSQANLEQYRAVVGEIATIEERQADQLRRKGQLELRIEDAEKSIRQHKERLAVLSESQVRAARDRDEARFMNRVVGALNELREALRLAVRGRLEERINVRFSELVTQHSLVERVTIDDLYTMTFADGSGREVGRTSLSSGLKQLAATALLWAMKDVSGLEMPVIIDTPLGRIDRENQDNMLINYFPQLAKQVIVLPTNTEIDQRRFDLIRDRVGVEYRIVNETGDRASVEPGTLVRA